MRAVLDPNVLISALLSATGAPAALLTRWVAGQFDLVVSELLLAELGRALAYPKVRARVSEAEALAFVDLLRRGAVLVQDPARPPRLSRDPGDDYLLALADAGSAVLVTGDRDLLALSDLPVRSPGQFLTTLRAST